MTSAKRPDGISSVTGEVLDVLERYTMFPWPLLKTQAERHALDPKLLTVKDVTTMLLDLHAALARFTSVEKADRARVELDLLVGRLK